MFKNGAPTLKDLAFLAESVQYLIDSRPKILRDMTDQAPTTLHYNRFLYELVQRYEPEVILELGTDRGRSAAHMASGNPHAIVLTLDIDPACTKQVNDLGWHNLHGYTTDSLKFKLEDHFIPVSKIVDLLFIDSLHAFEHARAEYDLYLPYVEPGGIILFDDIHLDAGMEKLWASIEEEKADLTPLHFSGFGAVKRGSKPPR
jgi:predicted O-methyltransferase YrrM